MSREDIVSALFVRKLQQPVQCRIHAKEFLCSVTHCLSGSYAIRERNNESAADAARRSEPFLVRVPEVRRVAESDGGKLEQFVTPGEVVYVNPSRTRACVMQINSRKSFPERCSMLRRGDANLCTITPKPTCVRALYVYVTFRTLDILEKDLNETKADFNTVCFSTNFYRN